VIECPPETMIGGGLVVEEAEVLAAGRILLYLHVHVVGGLHAGCFPAHRCRGCV